MAKEPVVVPSAFRGFSGRRTVNSVPTPTCDSTRISPLWLVTMVVQEVPLLVEYSKRTKVTPPPTV